MTITRYDHFCCCQAFKTLFCPTKKYKGNKLTNKHMHAKIILSWKISGKVNSIQSILHFMLLTKSKQDKTRQTSKKQTNKETNKQTHYLKAIQNNFKS